MHKVYLCTCTHNVHLRTSYCSNDFDPAYRVTSTVVKTVIT